MANLNKTILTGRENNSVACQAAPDTGTEITLKVFAFSVILFMATTGNLLVIWVVLKNKSMRLKPINLFIVNLAVSDLLLALFAIPGFISDTLVGQGVWLITGDFGAALCKIFMFVLDVATAVSIQSLVIIAFDRFLAVVYPLRTATVSCATRLVVIPMTWLLACAIHSPYFYIFRLETVGNTTWCVSVWSPDMETHLEISRKYYLAMFCLFVVIPVILLTVLYAVIFNTLRLTSRKRSLRTSDKQSKRRKEQEWNVLKMALAIVLGFAVCCGPFNVVVFLRIFEWEILDTCSIETLFFITTFLFYSITALNPIIYFVFSENFRLGFLRVFTHHSENSASKCFLKAMKHMQHSGEESGRSKHKITLDVLNVQEKPDSTPRLVHLISTPK